MSYAAVAASGPKQTPEESASVLIHTRRAPPVPELNHDEEAATLIDVDSDHVTTVKSDFEEQTIKTETQAEEHARETAREADRKAAEAKKEADAKAAKVKEEAKKKEAEAKEKAAELKESAEEKAEELKTKAASAAKKAKKEIKAEAKHFDDNKDNPVFIGNYVLWTVTAAAVGYGAYQKNKEGKLDAQLVGTVAAGLGLLGAVDYFASKWLVQNKYPTK